MDKSLDLETVRAFLAIARHGSFSAAAREINRTQAAISQQMQRLEDGLGARLMERTTRSVALTLAGARFLPFAEQLLEADLAARQAASGLAARGETVSIGAPDEIMSALLIPAVKQVGDDGLDAIFRLRSGATRGLIERLGRDLDAVLGLSFGDADGGRLINRTPLAWIGRWQADGPVPLLVYPEGCLMRTQAMSALDRAGIAWSVAVEVGGAGAIVAAAEAGLGVGILPEACLPHDVARAAALPPLPEIEFRLWTAGSAHDDALSRIAERVSHIGG